MNIVTKKYLINGIVQGVGFRPFVYKEAIDLDLKGWVLNSSEGVTIEVQGTKESISNLIKVIKFQHPPLASIKSIKLIYSKKKSTYSEFKILESKSNNNRNTLIAPDFNVCDDCLKEVFNQQDRRYKYPFINCTNCGPRFSIIQDIPYDRKHTTMKSFVMCDECQKEYDNPLDRRFHAQPTACKECGPKVSLVDKSGTNLYSEDEAISQTVKLLKSGKIIAIKSLGGFHLVIDPSNSNAIDELRKRKTRKYKPFALMAQSIEAIQKFAFVSSLERKSLLSIERPIVLLRKKDQVLYENLAPGLNELGVMLPSTPLQYLILKDNFDSLVFTSANPSNEPIIHKNDVAIKKLSDIADYFLIHDRDIENRTDDSICRVIKDTEGEKQYFIRRSRGFAPKPINLDIDIENGIALGSELKNTICINKQNNFFVSQYIGDLKNNKTQESFIEILENFQSIREIKPKYIARDLHPDFFNTQYAEQNFEQPIYQIQHHHAHMVSCMAENQIKEKTIGVIFDGVGYGEDGTMWGSEFLIGDFTSFVRYGHLENFLLPTGDRSVKEPYRIAIGLLHNIFAEKLNTINLRCTNYLERAEQNLLIKIIDKKINSPFTCSMGRLFDAVASLIDVRHTIDYEGQAAIELEHIILADQSTDKVFSFSITQIGNKKIINFDEMIKEIVDQVLCGTTKSEISIVFHNTISKMIIDMCLMARIDSKVNKVVLSGGVFLNMYLLEKTVRELRFKDFEVFTHSKVPSNDGGISLGQNVIAGSKYKLGIIN